MDKKQGFARMPVWAAAHAWVAVALLLLVSACAKATPTPTPTRTPTPKPAPTATRTSTTAVAPVTVIISALGNSGQSGTATLTAKGATTEVVVNVTPIVGGPAQPAHIHSGKCATLGDIVYPLTDVVNGKSTTTVNATLDSLRTGNRAVNIHKSAADLNTYTACGNIPAK